uniref:DUF38 domain-containing protein n=1 Tax=Panagrolaimus sp. ES5 TaxID=591445 RepID=A0AC34FY98_9BILA
MDSSGSESTSLTSSEPSSLVFPTKAEFLKTYLQQAFSLPDSIMHNMAMNPASAEVYQKLIQSCKYFFVKNSILVLRVMYYKSNGWETFINGEWKDIDLSNISSKLWITDRFTVGFNNDNTIASSIIPKIYKCKKLILWEQILSYDEFMVLAPAVEHLDFTRVTVKYGDGTILPFEKIVEQLHEAKQIGFTSFGSEMITSKTFKELLKIPHFATLDEFVLYTIPESFDIESFYVYLKKNKHTKIGIHFCDTISDQYKTRLEAIIDEIINTFSLLSSAFIFSFFSSNTEMISSKTSKELSKIPHFATLDRFYLIEIPEVFDIESFYVHMKKNKHTKIGLHFCDTISVEYKIRHEAIIDEIIEATNSEYKTPFISFEGRDEEKDRKLYALYLKH